MPSVTSCCMDLRVFSPVIHFCGVCVCVLGTACDPWHPMNARLDWELGSLEARSVPSALRWWVETGAAPLQKIPGYIQVERVLRISVVSDRWHAWLCDPVFDVRGLAWKNTWCSLIRRTEADFPLQRRQRTHLRWCTSLVEKTTFLLLCFNHAHFKILTNQTMAAKHLPRWSAEEFTHFFKPVIIIKVSWWTNTDINYLL